MLLSSLVGGLFGAVSGAALLAVPTYLSKETGFMGPYSDWAILGVIYGSVFGVIPGMLIGFLVSKWEAGKIAGAAIGAGIGLSILLLLFMFGLDPSLDREELNFGLACIPTGGVIGLIVSVINPRPSFR